MLNFSEIGNKNILYNAETKQMGKQEYLLIQIQSMLLLLKSKTTTRGAIFFFRIRWRKEIRDDPSPSNDEDSVRCDPTNQEWPFLSGPHTLLTKAFVSRE